MEQEVFKACRDFGELFKSAIYSSRKALCLDYRIGEITKPRMKGSYIFAFSNITRAAEFGANCVPYPYVLLRCEAMVAHATIYRIPSSAMDLCNLKKGNRRITKAEAFWKFFQEGEVFRPAYYFLGHAPEGTVLCSWIKPIERIA